MRPKSKHTVPMSLQILWRKSHKLLHLFSLILTSKLGPLNSKSHTFRPKQWYMFFTWEDLKNANILSFMDPPSAFFLDTIFYSFFLAKMPSRTRVYLSRKMHLCLYSHKISTRWSYVWREFLCPLLKKEHIARLYVSRVQSHCARLLMGEEEPGAGVFIQTSLLNTSLYSLLSEIKYRPKRWPSQKWERYLCMSAQHVHYLTMFLREVGCEKWRAGRFHQVQNRTSCYRMGEMFDVGVSVQTSLNSSSVLPHSSQLFHPEIRSKPGMTFPKSRTPCGLVYQNRHYPDMFVLITWEERRRSRKHFIQNIRDRVSCISSSSFIKN